jgi:succinate dehydrogenase / fumarate reductase flavoprotein subunit
MQGLADGYFVLPNTITDYLADLLGDPPVPTSDPVFAAVEGEVDDRVRALLAVNGSRSVDWFHRELGKVLWDNCGMERSADSLKKALGEIPPLRDEFYADVRVLGENETFNQSLEKAGRVADFLEFSELMCLDALHREESCGGHFRVEHQTEDGEALRNDRDFSYVAAWEFTGVGEKPVLHKEPLGFEAIELAQRSYQ